MWARDYPWGSTEEAYAKWLDFDEAIFGPRHGLLGRLREDGFSAEEAEGLADYYRNSISPGSMLALRRINRDIDVRHVLPAIRVPTLIVHGTDDEVVYRWKGRATWLNRSQELGSSSFPAPGT